MSYAPFLNKGYHQQRKLNHEAEKGDSAAKTTIAEYHWHFTCSPHHLGSDFPLHCSPAWVCAHKHHLCVPLTSYPQTCTPTSLNSVFPSSFFLPHWCLEKGTTSVRSVRTTSIPAPRCDLRGNFTQQCIFWFNFLCHILYRDSKSTSMMLIQAKNLGWGTFIEWNAM